MNLAEQFPQRQSEIRAAGFPHIAGMMDHFIRAADMDRALGYQNATAAWLRGKSYPSTIAENAAAMWMQLRSPSTASPQVTLSGELLLVACPSPEVAAKLSKIAGMIGCEVTGV